MYILFRGSGIVCVNKYFISKTNLIATANIIKKIGGVIITKSTATAYTHIVIEREKQK